LTLRQALPSPNLAFRSAVPHTPLVYITRACTPDMTLRLRRATRNTAHVPPTRFQRTPHPWRALRFCAWISSRDAPSTSSRGPRYRCVSYGPPRKTVTNESRRTLGERPFARPSAGTTLHLPTSYHAARAHPHRPPVTTTPTPSPPVAYGWADPWLWLAYLPTVTLPPTAVRRDVPPPDTPMPPNDAAPADGHYASAARAVGLARVPLAGAYTRPHPPPTLRTYAERRAGVAGAATTGSGDFTRYAYVAYLPSDVDMNYLPAAGVAPTPPPVPRLHTTCCARPPLLATVSPPFARTGC